MPDPETLGSLLNAQIPTVPALLANGLLIERGKMILFGKYGSWKSIIALNLGMALAAGKSWLGIVDTPTDGTGTMYMQTEIPRKMLQERAQAVSTAFPAWHCANGSAAWVKRMWLWTPDYLKLDTASGLSELFRYTELYQPKIVVLDPLYALMSGDFLKVAIVNPFLDNLNIYIARTGVAVVLVAHPRKGEPDQTYADDLLGSSLYSDWADTLVRISNTGGSADEALVRLQFTKTRHAREYAEDIHLTIYRASLNMIGKFGSISLEAPR